MSLTRPPVVNPFANTVAPGPSDLFDVPTYFDSGFPAPSGVPVRPPLGFFNWLFWFATLGIRYILACCFSPWDATETQYTAPTVVSATGSFYVLRGTATTGTAPGADPTNWFPLTMLDRASAGDYANPIAAWRSVRAQRRFGIDHWGKPGGALYDWTENWAPGTPFDVGGVVNAAVGRWHLLSSAAGSNFSSIPPGVSAGSNTSNASRALQVAVDGASSGNRAEVRLNDDSTTSLFTDDALITLDMDITAYSVLSVIWVVGFTQVGELVNNVQHGAFFIRPDTVGTNWKCRTINGGAPTEVDSGVLGTANTPHHFRIELVGANADDFSVARAIFFIDGAEVANISATLPINIGAQMIPLFGGTVTGAVANPVLLAGPVRYSQITALATL